MVSGTPFKVLKDAPKLKCFRFSSVYCFLTLLGRERVRPGQVVIHTQVEIDRWNRIVSRGCICKRVHDYKSLNGLLVVRRVAWNQRWTLSKAAIAGMVLYTKYPTGAL